MVGVEALEGGAALPDVASGFPGWAVYAEVRRAEGRRGRRGSVLGRVGELELLEVKQLATGALLLLFNVGRVFEMKVEGREGTGRRMS